MADRWGLDGLSLAERFARIHENNLWRAEGSVSGPGSEVEATETLRRELPQLLVTLGVRKLLDAPCGDGEWMSRAELGVAYVGMDIVPSVVEKAQARSAGGDYLVGDITQDALPRADAILCRDCLVHLSFANIRLALANIHRSGAKWLITTTFPSLQVNRECVDGYWRPLNLELEPFSWPPPQHLLVEDCTEGRGAWKDKSLGVWKLEDLTHLLAPSPDDG